MGWGSLKWCGVDGGLKKHPAPGLARPGLMRFSKNGEGAWHENCFAPWHEKWGGCMARKLFVNLARNFFSLIAKKLLFGSVDLLSLMHGKKLTPNAGWTHWKTRHRKGLWNAELQSKLFSEHHSKHLGIFKATWTSDSNLDRFPKRVKHLGKGRKKTPLP